MESLLALDPCSDARAWLKEAKPATLEAAYATCPRADWMLWAIPRLALVEDEGLSRSLRLFALRCARSTPVGGGKVVFDLLEDERSRNAIEVAERYLRGEATREELQEARSAAAYASAAYVASFAAYADAAASYAAASASASRGDARLWQATELRAALPFAAIPFLYKENQ